MSGLPRQHYSFDWGSGVATKQSTRLKRRGHALKVGLVSDTHESEDPQTLINLLLSLRCDLHVHLGDVGGARGVMQAVREFKRTQGSVEGLDEQTRQSYFRLIEQGISPMRAYGEAILGGSPTEREQRRIETRENYTSVIRMLAGLDNAYCLTGNVDRALLRAGVLTDSGGGLDCRLVAWPEWLDFGETAIVLWPSMRVGNAEEGQRLRELVADFASRGQGKRQVVVFGHEQLFKGPQPGVYKSRVKARGLDSVNIPWFEPNPSWHYLVSLFRQLPTKVEVGHVFGHVHDPQDVVQAGIPYLKSASIMHYRLYGLGQRVCEGDRGQGLRRTLPVFYVPSNRVATLSLGLDGLGWEVFAP